MGKDFVWFVGVVEDRNDPVQMGRVRVRAFGWHTEDKGQIPTDALPWAVIVNNIQSASVSGIGHSPTGLVEGSWVVGFFMDGERAQEPIVLGSLNGVPVDMSNTGLGFNDPYGEYPRWTKIPDTNPAARESLASLAIARQHKNANRYVNGNERSIPTAKPPRLDDNVVGPKVDNYYQSNPWTELPAANDSIPEYPHNHVYETENGHLQEFDDTEGKERYHRYHPSGTYEEIIADGTRTIKVIGKNYELYMDGVNMYVEGDLNVTVNGNKRELIKGDYFLEVQGEVGYDFQQSWQNKVGGSFNQEIGHERSIGIAENDYLTVMRGDQTINVLLGAQNTTTGIGGASLITSGAYSATSLLGTSFNSGLTTSITAGTSIAATAGIGIDMDTFGYIQSTALGFRSETTGLYKFETVGGASTETVVGIKTENYGASHITDVVGAQTVLVGAAQTTAVGGGIFSAAGGVYNMSSAGIMTAIAPMIELNPL